MTHSNWLGCARLSWKGTRATNTRHGGKNSVIIAEPEFSRFKTRLEPFPSGPNILLFQKKQVFIFQKNNDVFLFQKKTSSYSRRIWYLCIPRTQTVLSADFRRRRLLLRNKKKAFIFQKAKILSFHNWNAFSFHNQKIARGSPAEQNTCFLKSDGQQLNGF